MWHAEQQNVQTTLCTSQCAAWVQAVPLVKVCAHCVRQRMSGPAKVFPFLSVPQCQYLNAMFSLLSEVQLPTNSPIVAQKYGEDFPLLIKACGLQTLQRRMSSSCTTWQHCVNPETHHQTSPPQVCCLWQDLPPMCGIYCHICIKAEPQHACCSRGSTLHGISRP